VHAATAPDRYQFHDLIRLFAREQLEAEQSAAQRERAANSLHERTVPGQ
jgi:hypothetical protein